VAMLRELWKHQRNEIEEHLTDKARAILWYPRTGKTRAMVESIRRLPYERYLVVVLKTFAYVWDQELGTYPHFDLTEGTIKQRAARLDKIKKGVVIVNYDVLWQMRNDIRRWKPEAIILDESHLIKRPGARRSMAAHLLGRGARWKRILSGTPNPKNLRDFYSQYKFLDLSVFGGNAKEFDDQYCILHPVYQNKVLGYKNLKSLRRKVFSIASRVRLEDCFDVPKAHEVFRRLKMPEDVAAGYQELAHHPFTSKLERLLRLQQFTSGIWPGFDGRETLVHDLKTRMVLAELNEVIESGEKAVVWCRFRAEQDALKASLETNFPDIPLWVLNGDSPRAYRNQLQHEFNKWHEPQIVVAQIQTGRLGVSFKTARTAIFTSLTYDYEHYEQAKLRTFDPEKITNLIFIELDKTVDQLIVKNIRAKQNVSSVFLDKIGWDPSTVEVEKYEA
jgi:hypothetical protein